MFTQQLPGRVSVSEISVTCPFGIAIAYSSVTVRAVVELLEEVVVKADLVAAHATSPGSLREDRLYGLDTGATLQRHAATAARQRPSLAPR